MTENRENWLYPNASGLYFPHDGFIMRATDGKQYDYEEECELLNELNDENEQFKMMIATLRNTILDQEDLEQKNKELQFQLNLLREQANEFHRGARENANRVGQLKKEKKELKQEIETLKMEIAELRESEKDNYNITDGLW